MNGISSRSPSAAMTAPKSAPPTDGLAFTVEPNAGNHLAWMNAILSLQRTLMAAERTAVTLIAFGFTVAQILAPQRLHLHNALESIRETS